MSPIRLTWAAVVLTCFVCPAPAAVVTLLNATDGEVAFTVEHPGGKPVGFSVAAGEVRAVPVGREPVLRVTLNGKPQAYKLEPYTPYLLVEHDDKQVVFSGVELAAELPKPDDVPAAPADRKPVVVPVTLFVDQRPVTKEVWEKAIRSRFAAAAAVVEKQAGVKFDVVGVGEWTSPAGAADLASLLTGFEAATKLKPGERAVGFTGRQLKEDALCSPAQLGGTHLLVRDALPKAEAERVEVLVQQLGTTIGAVRSPDRGSAMRGKLGDGTALRRNHRVQFDPLNLLVLHVWAEEMAAGRGPKPADLSQKARDRLRVLYKTLAGINEAMKTEDFSAHDLFDRIGLAAENAANAGKAPAVEPKPAEPKRDNTDRTIAGDADAVAVRTVIRAVTAKARELADARPPGDDLTAAYIRVAAVAAGGLDEAVRAKAFLVGIGLALDDSTVLRSKPLVRALCVAAESDDERADRLKVLGSPTVRGRRDLCQHFAVSAALTELFGAAAAEAAGKAKELLDAKGASGFSFADLAADLAGIEFAAAVKKDPARIAGFATGFAVTDHVPEVKALAEGLSAEKFKKDYGDLTDPRFTLTLDDLRTKVKALPAYQMK
jgi:hypothetical protein